MQFSIPDNVRLVRIQDPAQWSRLETIAGEVVTLTDLVDGAALDRGMPNTAQLTIRIPITHADHSTFTCYGWTLVFLWYKGMR